MCLLIEISKSLKTTTTERLTIRQNIRADRASLALDDDNGDADCYERQCCQHASDDARSWNAVGRTANVQCC